MEQSSDEELLAQAKSCRDVARQRELLDQLFSRYHARVGLWCFRVTGDRDSGADLAQEIFIKVQQNLESFRGDAKFSTWLYTVTRNHCLNDAHRRAARRESAMEPIEMDLPHDDRFDLRMERDEEARHMRKLLAETLDETEHRVMALHYGEEMTLETITRLLGLTNASGAKAFVVSARRKLKTAVARWRAQQAGSRRSE